VAEEADGVGMEAAEIGGDGDGDGGGSSCKTEETLNYKTMEEREKKERYKRAFRFLFFCFFFLILFYYIIIYECFESEVCWCQLHNLVWLIDFSL